MNQRNEAVWARRGQEMRQRLTIPHLVEKASELVRTEVTQGCPIIQRRSFEGALEFAELNGPRLFKISKGLVVPALPEDVERELAAAGVETEETAPGEAVRGSEPSLAAALAADARARGRRGGRAAKADELTKALFVILLENPSLSQRDAFRRLRALKGNGIFISVTEVEIQWTDHAGRLHTAKTKKLKDRIYRVRKAINKSNSPPQGTRPLLNENALQMINSLSRQAA